MINWLRSRMQTGPVWIGILLLAGVLGIGLVAARQIWVATLPQAVMQEYVAAVYARDYSQAYAFISETDRNIMTQAEYIQQNGSFTGFPLDVTQQLASYIEYDQIQVERQGDRATVSVQFVVPDGNANAIRSLLADSETELTAAEHQAILEKLAQLHESGQLPTIEGEQTFVLVRERGKWWIFENWAESVRVYISGEVKEGLSWSFAPLQTVVRAKPGQTVQTVYRVQNLSDQPVTAKARHIDTPVEYLEFLNIIQCFCFVQHTLAPGEEAELSLVFRVAWDVPAEVSDFSVHYEFYPIDSFPED